MLKVALLQILPGASREENHKIGMEWCRKAKKQGADIALFPEMWSSGYQISEDVEKLRQEAVSADGEFVMSFGRLAKELDMAIAVTFLERHEPLPRNTMALFDRHGKKVLEYAKVHTCDFGEECRLTAGDDFYVTDLDTAEGMVKIGAMICFDREFPESARILMLKGAEIVLVPNACPMEINRLSQLRARAFENMTAIATANYAAGQPDCNGHSSAFDGIAYDETSPVSRDTLLIEAGEEEGIYLAHVPLDKLRSYRRSEVHGNAYRRPRLYGALTEERVEEPFRRPDRRDL